MKNIFITVLKRSRRTWLALLFATLLINDAMACEICGCSINGYHFGILPQWKKNLIGMRYSYKGFHSQHLISEQLGILGSTSTEYYNSVELWGRFYLGKKLQVFAFVPYNYYNQNEPAVKTTASGIGDITIAANYTLYNDASNKDKIFKQTLLAGGGIKLPAGKFKSSKAGEVLNPSMNSGSGSVDYLTNMIYTCRLKRIGLNLDASYRINSQNKEEFKYGNRFTTAAKFFYWKDIGKKLSLLPNAGLLYEHAAQDQHHTEIQNYSGGEITWFTAGVEGYAGKINIGFTYNHPVAQNMSKGLVNSNDTFSANITFMF